MKPKVKTLVYGQTRQQVLYKCKMAKGKLFLFVLRFSSVLSKQTWLCSKIEEVVNIISYSSGFYCTLTVYYDLLKERFSSSASHFTDLPLFFFFALFLKSMSDHFLCFPLGQRQTDKSNQIHFQKMAAGGLKTK